KENDTRASGISPFKLRGVNGAKRFSFSSRLRQIKMKNGIRNPTLIERQLQRPSESDSRTHFRGSCPSIKIPHSNSYGISTVLLLNLSSCRMFYSCSGEYVLTAPCGS